MTRRVAVTGLGCISGLGQGVKGSWDTLTSGGTGIRTLSRAFRDDPRFPMEGPAAYIEAMNGDAVEGFAGRRVLGQLDPVSSYALIATHEALADAGLIDEPDLRSAACIIYGSASGGNATIEESFGRLFLNLQARVHPLTIPKYMGSASASQLSMIFGIRGSAYGVSSACASSAHALSEGMHMIRAGRAKIVVTGGSDASINYGSWVAWKALQAMSPDPCRPFSTGRNGLTLGEGAATLILEDLDHARARGATIYGELLGSGASSDAFDLTQPDGIGAVNAMTQAYADAGISADAPALISAHGTGTALNDKTEAAVIREVYGDKLARQAVIATKSAHGHLLGAGGAIEFLIGLLALRDGVAPPILNYAGPDPECDLPLVLEGGKPVAAEVLVSNSFAFGGLNSTLVAGRL